MVVPVPYDFMPSAEELLEELIPTVVKITVFQAFIEASVSEHFAEPAGLRRL